MVISRSVSLCPSPASIGAVAEAPLVESVTPGMCDAEEAPEMESIQSLPCEIDLAVTSMTLRPQTLTASASGFSRWPSHEWHGRDIM